MKKEKKWTWSDTICPGSLPGPASRRGRRLAVRFALVALGMTSALGYVEASPAKQQHPIQGRLPPGSTLVPLAGHAAAPPCLEFAPDGNLLVSASIQTVLIWDVGAREIVHRVELERPVLACRFLPSGDRVVLSTADGTLSILDAASGRILRKLGTPSEFETIGSLAVRPDGSEILAGSNLGNLKAWSLTSRDTEKGHQLAKLDHAIWTVGYLSSGEWFASTSAGALDVGSSAGERHQIQSDVQSVAQLSGKWLAIGFANGNLDLAQVGGSAPIRLGGTTHRIYTIASHLPTSRLLTAESGVDQAAIWSLLGGQRLCDLKGAGDLVRAAFRPQGDLVAVGTQAGLIRLIDASTCGVRATLGDARTAVLDSDVSPDRTLVGIGDSDGQLTIWNTTSWTLDSVQRISAAALTKVIALDGRRFLVANSKSELFVAGPEGVRFVGRQDDSVYALSVSPDYRFAYAGGFYGHLLRWDLAAGKSTELANLGEDVEFRSITARRLAPNSNEHDLIVTTAHGQSAVHRIRFGSNGPIDTPIPSIEGSKALVYGFAASEDGRYLMEIPSSGVVYILDGTTARLIKKLNGLDPTFHTATISNSHVFAVRSDDVLLRWPLLSNTSEPEWRLPLATHDWSINVTGDEKFLITGSTTGEATIRNSSDGHAVAQLVPMRDGSWATVYADGSFVASAGAARDLRVQSSDSRRLWTLGQLARQATGLRLKIGEPRVQRFADGSAEVQFLVVAPCGRPTVTLDGWPVRVLASDEKAASTYVGEMSLFEPVPAGHLLSARDGCSASTARFDTPPDPQLARSVGGQARVLAVGVGQYRAFPPLSGAPRDAQNVATAFRSASSWALDEPRSHALVDPTNADLRSAVRDFLSTAARNETLFFYFAGHMGTFGGRRYLLGADAQGKDGALSLDEVSKWLQTSHASQVAVLIDACEAGEPTGKLPAPSAVKGARVVITSTAADVSARETKDGGLFTRAFLDGMKTEARADPSGAVTLNSAVTWAMSQAHFQYPTITWGGEYVGLQRLALAYPKARTPAVTAAKGEGEKAGIKVEYEIQAMRQVATDDEVEVAPHQMKMRVYLDRAAWLRFSIYPEIGSDPLYQEYRAGLRTGDSSREVPYAPGAVSVSVPLRRLPRTHPAKYRGRIEACEQTSGGAMDCDLYPAVEFTFMYPPSPGH